MTYLFVFLLAPFSLMSRFVITTDSEPLPAANCSELQIRPPNQPTNRGQTIEQLKYRLQPNASDLQAAAYMVGVIKQSFLNFRTAAYDRLQYIQNEIPY